MQGKSLLEIAQVEKKRMDQSLLHKLSLLDVHKLSLLQSLSCKDFQGGRRSRELQKSQKNPTKITSIYSLISLFFCSVFARRSRCSIYSPQRELSRRWTGGRNLGLNGPDFAAQARQGAANPWPLSNGFLLKICYEVVIHVAFQNLELLRRILQILGSNLGFELISLIIAN